MIRLAIANDYELVVAGVAAMLSEDRHRIRVTTFEASAGPADSVDVILYDTVGPVRRSMDNLEELIRRSGVPVIVYTWKLHPGVAREALRRGAAGYLSKALSGDEVADAVQAVVRGDVVVSPEIHPVEHLGGRDRPGRRPAGLSARETEVLTMVAAGMSNQEVADQTYLSINSVKTYIRTAYRKIDVERRSQAVRWALEHGLSSIPDPAAESDAAPD